MSVGHREGEMLVLVNPAPLAEAPRRIADLQNCFQWKGDVQDAQVGVEGVHKAEDEGCFVALEVRDVRIDL